jgi:hypothetical protein
MSIGMKIAVAVMFVIVAYITYRIRKHFAKTKMETEATKRRANLSYYIPNTYNFPNKYNKYTDVENKYKYVEACDGWENKF